ncbi:glycosyltransferase [Macrococcus lamae]|uniref:Glycosyltransferase n=1 Tax=Macrococcus lamae TaxID=198484 RepID=A0A4R6BWJ8_9STAP|nr:glycosyltransferase [Macrococcus lamae]TDM12392.1 glycosyltransferase [Macrococcus lamae]
MIKIAFLHERKSYLPEIDAYVEFLNSTDKFEAVIVENVREIDETYDIIWKVMGIDLKRKRGVGLVHEYSTMTVGKNAKLKDFIKRTVNCKPDGRAFQSKRVQDVYNFKDNTPFIYRDMGVHHSYYDVHSDKEYDFVYVGTMDPTRQLDNMMKFFEKNREMSIILIGTPDEELQKVYGSLPNVTFYGRVPNNELPSVAAKAHYGLNYIPDVFPFNEQTSTKLIEYCALNLKIVTTNYQWINEFEEREGGHFFKVEEDMSNLSRTALDNFDFKTPDLRKKEWSRLLTDAGLVEFLTEIYQKNILRQK